MSAILRRYGTQSHLVHMNWAPLDEACASELRRSPGAESRWLLEQTIATAGERRSLLGTIPNRRGWEVLDFGTGYGAMAIEIAHAGMSKVLGIDRDPEVLKAAKRIVHDVGGWLTDGSAVEFDLGGIEALADRQESFDLAVARLVLQHTSDRADVVRALCRSVRHGGYVWLFDADDGLSASHPPTSAVYEELEAAFLAWQDGYGGDRFIGRKLPVLLAEADMFIHDVLVVPQSTWAVDRPDSAERQGAIARLRSERDAIVGGGFIESSRFDELLEAYAAEAPVPRLRIESQVVVLAQRP